MSNANDHHRNSGVTGSSSSGTANDETFHDIERKKLKVVYGLLQEILQEIFKFFKMENHDEQLKARLIQLIETKMDAYLSAGGFTTLIETYIQDEYVNIFNTIQNAMEEWIDTKLEKKVNRLMNMAVERILLEVMETTDAGRVVFREAREKIRCRRNAGLSMRVDQLETQLSYIMEELGRKKV